MKPSSADGAGTRPISIAILAIGGQGGGTMAEWTVRAGERSGLRAQYTSVAGVAQRTGATIYYIEFFPEAVIRATGKEPVLSLMPVPGDVDIVVASELMEAGRAINRGFVTPDRTTLIASTHRVYAIAEKSAMGDGRGSGEEVIAAAEARARRFLSFDMDAAAAQGGSVISAAMLGALAGSGTLPIARADFEAVIAEGGKGAAASLRTFALAYDRASAGGAAGAGAMLAAAPALAVAPAVMPLVARLERIVPPAARLIARDGLRRVLDYQDLAYGTLYLDRLERIAAADTAGGSRAKNVLTVEGARHLALWMSFEDSFRVADLKTRGERFERIRGEMAERPGQIVDLTEFMHPRIEEVCDSLPAAMGGFILARPRLSGALSRLFARGRYVRTSGLPGFLMLYLLGSMRRFRRGTLRYRRESAAIERWLDRIVEAAAIDTALAVELVRCQRLVKGYGDTHERGWRSFSALMDAYEGHKAGRGFARKLGTLAQAALADDKGIALGAALAKL